MAGHNGHDKFLRVNREDEIVLLKARDTQFTSFSKIYVFDQAGGGELLLGSDYILNPLRFETTASGNFSFPPTFDADIFLLDVRNIRSFFEQDLLFQPVFNNTPNDIIINLPTGFINTASVPSPTSIEIKANSYVEIIYQYTGADFDVYQMASDGAGFYHDIISDTHTDTMITGGTLNTDDVLQYNGTKWTNVPPIKITDGVDVGQLKTDFDTHVGSSTDPHGSTLTQTNLICDNINATTSFGVRFQKIIRAPNILLQGGNPGNGMFLEPNRLGLIDYATTPETRRADLQNDVFRINTINEIYSDAGVTIDGCLIKDGTVDGVDVNQLKTDFDNHAGSSTDPHGSTLTQTTLNCSTINEGVAEAGVTIDGCLIKDGNVDGVDVSQLETNFNAHVGASTDPHGTTLTQTTLACSTINERVPDAGVTIDGCLIKDGTVDGVDVSQLQSDTAAHILNSVNPHGVTLTQTTLNCSTINEAGSDVGVTIDGTHIKDNTINLGGTFRTSEIPIYTFRNNESRVYLESNGATLNTLMLTNNARTKGCLFGLNDAGNVYLDGGSGLIIISNQATFSAGGTLPSYTPSVNAAMIIYNSNLVTFPSGIKTGFESSTDSTTIQNFFEILETSTTTQQPWDDPQDVKIYIQKINVTVSITVIGYNLGTANANGANIILTGVIPLHCRPLSQVEQPFLVVDNHDFRLGKIIVHTNGDLEFAPSYFTPGEKFTNDSGIFQQSVRYPIA